MEEPVPAPALEEHELNGEADGGAAAGRPGVLYEKAGGGGAGAVCARESLLI